MSTQVDYRKPHIFDPIHDGANECECGFTFDADIHTSETVNHETEVKQEAPPDISADDSKRLQGFVRMTSVEIKAVGGVGAATSLEMIGYIRELEQRLATVRREAFKEAIGVVRNLGGKKSSRWNLAIDTAVVAISSIEASASGIRYHKLSCRRAR